MSSFKILFVCIGNTCRSPMAESVLAAMARENELHWEIDSAGLRNWNVGYRPEDRCIKVLAENGLTTDHIGRMISVDDFQEFDFILAMDQQNLKDLRILCGQAGKEPKAKIELLGSYIGREEDKIIIDPYFSNGIGVFRNVYLQISESCKQFIRIHK